MFDEMSKKLHHALTDVRVENKAENSTQVRYKLYTGASGNLLPV